MEHRLNVGTKRLTTENRNLVAVSIITELLRLGTHGSNICGYAVRI
jgi:hypothetical protein